MEEKGIVEEVKRKEPVINEGMAISLATFEGVHKFKSVRRAIRRGHVAPYGRIYPKRPFSNSNTKKNRIKQQIYVQLKNYRKAA